MPTFQADGQCRAALRVAVDLVTASVRGSEQFCLFGLDDCNPIVKRYREAPEVLCRRVLAIP